ncbi:unnamed protein product, partial [Staurois parvus]
MVSQHWCQWEEWCPIIGVSGGWNSAPSLVSVGGNSAPSLMSVGGRN